MFGAPLVGFLAEFCFHYNINQSPSSEMDPNVRHENTQARASLTLTLIGWHESTQASASAKSLNESNSDHASESGLGEVDTGCCGGALDLLLCRFWVSSQDVPAGIELPEHIIQSPSLNHSHLHRTLITATC